MTTFIDRRLNPRDKTIKNRQKFIHRSKAAIRQRVKEIIDKGSIKDISTTKAKVKVKGISEPHFRADPKTGNHRYVMPGNKQFVPGDKVPKPEGGGGGGQGRQAGKGRGEDDFEFLLTQEEFLDFLFDELELPNLVKKQMKNTTQLEYHKAGFKSWGTPAQLDLVRSMKNALGRRIGLKRPKNEEIEELEERIQDLNAVLSHGNPPEKDVAAELELELKILTAKLAELKARQISVPWLDPFDVKYRNYEAVPKPITQAVMFCVMDISASMQEKEKDIAKRFFMLLHLFLQRKYEKLEVVFISHHDSAKEVDEDTFFRDKETGGTLVSSALELTNEIIKERYPTSDWNIYVAQSSDGDNASWDRQNVADEMAILLPKVQYFAYVEAANMHTVSMGMISEVWHTYHELQDEWPQLQIKMVFDNTQIWQVLSELFAKEQAK
jgi:uncharacterized sporulation protein YeaH/YhbH (DUF444 family)